MCMEQYKDQHPTRDWFQKQYASDGFMQINLDTVGTRQKASHFNNESMTLKYYDARKGAH